MADFERIFGLRQSYSVLYDAMDHFFREGGNQAYISRIVGPAAVIASKNLLDGSAGISLVVKAIGAGATPNTYKVGVRAGGAGGTVQIFVQDVNSVEVESSPDLATQAAAVNWSLSSNYIRVTLGATALMPAVVAAAVLTGGNDDRANIVDAQWQAGLDAITPDFGPGQVLAPGRTTDPGHLQLVNHAAANRRVALLDAPDTPTVATLQSSATGARNLNNQRFAAMFAPWVVIPGIVGGVPRTVPPSSMVAGIIARNDSQGKGSSEPAAGDLGISLYATNTTQVPWTDTQRGTLNGSGIDVVRAIFGGVRAYGWRSLVDQLADPLWVNFGHARLYMSISARAAVIAESYEFDQIDGQGKMISAFNADLTRLMLDYFTRGELYGVNPADAFSVDTSPAVNTPTTLANNELHAVINAKMSPFAEMVMIEIVKRAITEVI
jgi:phage tail sheath protein FI